MSIDKIVFKTKKFSDLLEEIYNNQKKKENKISKLVDELTPMINDIGDATLLVPLIKEYLDLGIKNDEQLIKMATIIQRVFQANPGKDSDDLGLTQKDRDQIMEIAKQAKEIANPTK